MLEHDKREIWPTKTPKMITSFVSTASRATTSCSTPRRWRSWSRLIWKYARLSVWIVRGYGIDPQAHRAYCPLSKCEMCSQRQSHKATWNSLRRTRHSFRLAIYMCSVLWPAMTRTLSACMWTTSVLVLAWSSSNNSSEQLKVNSISSRTSRLEVLSICSLPLYLP